MYQNSGKSRNLKGLKELQEKKRSLTKTTFNDLQVVHNLSKRTLSIHKITLLETALKFT